MSKFSRDKGKRGELKVCNILRPTFPNVGRHLEFQADEAALGKDLKNTDNLDIQVKNYAKHVSVSKLKEVNGTGIPILWSMANREKDIIVLYADDFLKIINDIGVVYNKD